MDSSSSCRSPHQLGTKHETFPSVLGLLVNLRILFHTFLVHSVRIRDFRYPIGVEIGLLVDFNPYYSTLS